MMLKLYRSLQILTAITEGEVPGGPPKNLKVEPSSSTELKVTWDPPDDDLLNGEILGYHVGYKEQRYDTFPSTRRSFKNEKCN